MLIDNIKELAAKIAKQKKKLHTGNSDKINLSFKDTLEITTNKREK